MKTVIAYSIILASAIAASAHLGTLSEPKAGQTYQVGSTLPLKWTMDVGHGTQDIAYSKANGPWVTITTGLRSTVTAENWTIPAAAQGSNIRIRICQRSGNTGCNDTHNTSQPGGGSGGVYTLISGNFTVAAPTSIAAGSAFEGASLDFHPGKGNVEVAFSLAAPERVTLEAFDAQGKRIAVLLDERKAEGRHVLSVHSPSLDAATPFLLRLQAGDKVLQKGRL